MPLHLESAVGFVLGLGIVFSTIGSIIDTLIVTRSVRSRITLASWELVRYVFRLLMWRTTSYEHKDKLLTFRGPLALVAALTLWIALFLLGYALMFWPFVEGGIWRALDFAGSSFFTLGSLSSPKGVPTALSFAAAASGMITIALQIGYLPTLYSSYNRRETLITALSIRVRRIAWGPNILSHHYKQGQMSTLPALFASWELWAADIAESHVSHPWLTVFRSPSRMNSWIVSLLAMTDAAALYLVLKPSQAPPEAQQSLMSGITCMRTLSEMLGFTEEKESSSSAPISLTFEEFEYGVGHLEAAGFAPEVPITEAWEAFKHYRGSYEQAAYAIADFVVAVPAPWTGMRENMTPETILPSARIPLKT